MFADVWKQELQQDVVTELLPYLEAGEQSAIVEVTHNFVPRFEVMLSFAFVVPEHANDGEGLAVNGHRFSQRNDLPPAQQLRLLGFWRAQLREWDTAYYILNVTNTDPQLLEALREQIADILSNSPNMYRQWRDSPRYTDVFNDLMEELATELDLE